MQIFSTDVHKVQFTDSNVLSELSDYIVNSIPMTDTHMLFSPGGWTSAQSWKTNQDEQKLHQTDRFASMTKFIEQEAKVFWDNQGYYKNVNPKIFQSWVNVYERSSSLHYPHTHLSAPLSAVFYFNSSEEQGNLVFENPIDTVLGGQPIELPYKNFSRDIVVNTGDLVIFPGYLKHYTLPNRTDKKRIVFVANINATGAELSRSNN